MPNPTTPSGPSGFQPPLGDPLIDDRLARLAARRSPTAEAAAATGRVTPKRRHAARGSRSAALAMSVTTTLGLAAYLQRADAVTSTDTAASSPVAPLPTAAAVIGAATRPLATPAATLPTTIAPVATPAPVIATTPVATAVAPTVPPAPVASGSGLIDGTYAGDTFTNKWGPIQVQVTISNGAITDVTALQTPTKDAKSVRINDRAVPQLNTETVTAQSAQIDIVSGATYTSKGYRQSIQSALDAAQSTLAA